MSSNIISVEKYFSFLKEALGISHFFSHAIITGSAARSDFLPSFSDIDLILITADLQLEKAKRFVEDLAGLSRVHLDYILLTENEFTKIDESHKKFHLLWTAKYLSRNLLGELDLTMIKCHNFESYVLNKIKGKPYCQDGKLMFPKVGDIYLLKPFRDFLAAYSYLRSTSRPPYFDKNYLIENFPEKTPVEEAIKKMMMQIQNLEGEVTDSAENRVIIMKLDLLGKELYQEFQRLIHEY